jgi:hypothetical protein
MRLCPPLHFETWKSKGDALFGQKCNDKAIESYDRAIDIDPLNFHVQNNRNYAINARINDITNENKKGIGRLRDSM